MFTFGVCEYCEISFGDLTISVRYGFVTYYVQFNGSVLWTLFVFYSFTAWLGISVEIIMLQICNIGSGVVTVDIFGTLEDELHFVMCCACHMNSNGVN